MFIHIVRNVTFLLFGKKLGYLASQTEFCRKPWQRSYKSIKLGQFWKKWDKWDAYPFFTLHKTACRIKLIAKTMKEGKVGMLKTKHTRDLFI